MIFPKHNAFLGMAGVVSRSGIHRDRRIILVLFVGTLSTLASVQAAAREISYRYVELTGTAGESAGEDSLGVSVAGYYNVSDVIFVSGHVISSEVDTKPESHAEFYRIGVGARKGLTQSLDGLLSINYGRLDLDLPLPNGRNVGFEESGGIIEGGVRGLVGDAWEYSALLQLVDWDTRDLSYRAGANYRIGQSPVSVGLYYAHYESAWDQIELGLRYRFD